MNLITAILKSINIQIVIKITILKHLITVLVFINMNYLIMMWTVGNKNCIKASDVKLITFLTRWRDDYNILVSSFEYSRSA